MTRIRLCQLLSNKLSSLFCSELDSNVADPLLAAIRTFDDEAGELGQADSVASNGGLGWDSIHFGDSIILPYGSMYPMVLRLDRQEGKHWSFLGLTFAKGIATYKMKEILKSGHATRYTLK